MIMQTVFPIFVNFQNWLRGYVEEQLVSLSGTVPGMMKLVVGSEELTHSLDSLFWLVFLNKICARV